MTSAQYPTDVRVDVLTTLTAPDGVGLPVPAELSYRRGDPYAVHIRFDTSEDARVVWTFARDLLAEGLRRPSGLGDVRVAPGVGPCGTANQVHLTLSSPTGTATFELDHDEVTRFLRSTLSLVPAGAEAGQFDLDAELAGVLARNT